MCTSDLNGSMAIHHIVRLDFWCSKPGHALSSQVIPLLMVGTPHPPLWWCKVLQNSLAGIPRLPQEGTKMQKLEGDPLD